MVNLSEEEIKERLKHIEDRIEFCKIHNLSGCTLSVKTQEMLLDLYTKEKEKNKELNLENQALYESINCNDDNMLARRYEKLQKELDNIYLELQKQNCEIRKLKLENIKYQLSQLPDTTETYKELKKQYEELLKEN